MAPDYLARLDAAFARVDAIIDRYRDGDGYRPFTDITPDRPDGSSRARWRGLTEVLSQLAGTLGLTA